MQYKASFATFRNIAQNITSNITIPSIFARFIVSICVFVVFFILFATNAIAISAKSINILNPTNQAQTSQQYTSQNKDSAKPFILESDSLVIAPDSRIKSIKPPAQNPASEILNPKKALSEESKANAELLDSSVIPQHLPRAKIPSPLIPPPALTPHTDISEPLEKREFIISYKALSQNGIITGEKYNISIPIISKSTLPIAYTCSLDTPINDLVTDDESYAIKYVLYFYKDLVLDCLEKGGTSVLSYAQMANATPISDDTLLSVPARRILAYFDNRYLILEILKELQ